MIAKMKFWGNSLAVRLPKAITAELGLSDGSEVDLLLERGCLRLKPVGSRQKELERKLQGVTRENLHGEAGFGSRFRTGRR